MSSFVTLFRSVHVGVLLLSLGLLGCGDQDTDPVVEASDANSFNKEVWVSPCGDGRIDSSESEECDRDALDDETCGSLQLGAGVLRCNNECRFDVSSCEGTGSCGDGRVNRGEECECIVGYTRSLICAEGQRCSPEEQDGCTLDCQLEPPVCGDGIAVAPFEDCDTTQFFQWLPGPRMGPALINVLRYDEGTVRCDSDCRTDLTDATPATCGNAIIEADEICELSGVSREPVDLAYWSCRDCSEIVDQGVCGDGIIQRDEQCDRTDFGTSPTCESYGFGRGELTCTLDCNVDFTGCEGYTPTSGSDAGATEADNEDENAGCNGRPAHSPNGFLWLAGVVVAGFVARRRRRG